MLAKLDTIHLELITQKGGSTTNWRGISRTMYISTHLDQTEQKLPLQTSTRLQLFMLELGEKWADWKREIRAGLARGERKRTMLRQVAIK